MLQGFGFLGFDLIRNVAPSNNTPNILAQDKNILYSPCLLWWNTHILSSLY